MTPELQKYYENRFDMMASQGWRDLIEDIREMVKAVDTLSNVTPDNLQFKQGELSVMKWLLGLQELSEQAYKGLQNATDE